MQSYGTVGSPKATSWHNQDAAWPLTISTALKQRDCSVEMQVHSPPCSKRIPAGCLRIRDAHRENRFGQWTCKPCQRLEAFCNECNRACLADRSFDMQLHRLRQRIDELERLPKRYEPDHEDAAEFIHNCRQDRSTMCQLKKDTMESLPHWTWKGAGVAKRQRASVADQ